MAVVDGCLHSRWQLSRRTSHVDRNSSRRLRFCPPLWNSLSSTQVTYPQHFTCPTPVPPMAYTSQSPQQDLLWRVRSGQSQHEVAAASETTSLLPLLQSRQLLDRMCTLFSAASFFCDCPDTKTCPSCSSLLETAVACTKAGAWSGRQHPLKLLSRFRQVPAAGRAPHPQPKWQALGPAR